MCSNTIQNQLTNQKYKTLYSIPNIFIYILYLCNECFKFIFIVRIISGYNGKIFY